MKYMLRLYRFVKPVCIYTSYLFTSLTVLYMAGGKMTGWVLPFNPGILWGLFVFSLGSIGLGRVILGTRLLGRAAYFVRLVLYVCGMVLWGYLCLDTACLFYEPEPGARATLIFALAAGVICGVVFELFNRYRTHMYNTLLEEYKRRKSL